MSDSTFEHPGEPGRDGQAENVTELHRPVDFTIDGRPERTTVRRQTAADLLRLVGLDPARYDLGQLHGHDHTPTRFRDDADHRHPPGRPVRLDPVPR